MYVFHLILKNEHRTELQTNEQHQKEAKNTGTATADTSAENYRTRRPRDRRESVYWVWLGHRFFILIYDNYIYIENESTYIKESWFRMQTAFHILCLQFTTIF